MAPLARVKRLHPAAIMPHFKLDGDAGADLACVEECTLQPGEMKDIAVGLAIEAPVGMWYEIRPRSSTLRKRGLHVEPGTIDEGYRGPLYVFVHNANGHPVTVMPGDRLAQIVFHQRNRPIFEWADELSPSDRGEGGFGSTGLGLEPPLAAYISTADRPHPGLAPGVEPSPHPTVILPPTEPGPILDPETRPEHWVTDPEVPLAMRRHHD